MKPWLKYWSHEAEFMAIVLITVLVLSIVIFPLFIALLPILLITGWSVVWDLDHWKVKQ